MFYSQSSVHLPLVYAVRVQVLCTNLIRIHGLKNQYAREVVAPESFLNSNVRKKKDTENCSVKSIVLRWVKKITASVQEMALFSCGFLFVVMQDNHLPLRSGK